MLFSEVIGQEEVKRRLSQSVAQSRLSHALLFLAPEGAGGLPLALAFAQYIVCNNRQGEESCGECDQCKKAARLIHPDIHYSYPVIPKKSGDKPVSTDYIKEWREFIGEYPYGNVYDWLQFIGAENKQGNITANECQDILRKLSLKSFESEFRILILWMPEYLEKEGNRLLKIIEEPPAKTVFILAAENQEEILGTILSRTQLVKINPLGKEDIRKALTTRAGLSETQASQTATLSQGNYHEALQLARNAGSDLMELLRNWLNYILRRQPKELVRWIEQMGSAKTGRENQKQFLRYFINLLEHALRLQYLDEGQLPLPPEEKDFALRMNRLADFTRIGELIRELDAACYHIERNANGKILFHALSIRLQYIFTGRVLASER